MNIYDLRMGNANVRMHVSEAKLWQTISIVEQGDRHRENGEVCGVNLYPSLGDVPTV